MIEYYHVLGVVGGTYIVVQLLSASKALTKFSSHVDSLNGKPQDFFHSEVKPPEVTPAQNSIDSI